MPFAISGDFLRTDRRMEMKAKMLSLLAAVAMFGAVSAASAAEPLTNNQLDSVVGGAVNIAFLTFASVSANGPDALSIVNVTTSATAVLK
jgi:hypothetical protein